jgi:predicted ATPase
VGREDEVARLDAVVADLVAGRGQVLLVIGDMGLGKTRLLGELRVRAGDQVSWLEGACLSYEGQPAGGALVDILRQWLGVVEGDAEVAVRTRLRAKLGALTGPRVEELLPFLSTMLALKLDPESEERLRGVPADEAAAALWNAYVSWIEALAATQPVVVAVEDLHWAVPATTALLEALLEATERAPVLLATTLRPETGTEGWKYRMKVLSEYGHRTMEVSLPPLADDAVRQLLSLLMPVGLDDELREEIVQRAEGNPLYVEQLLQVMLQEAGVGRRRTWTLSLSAADLPPALEALLVARVDRLPDEAKHLAQIAAVIGRTFQVRLLERVAGEEAVGAGLPVLLRSEVVRELRRYPEFECTFRHGLLQEAALSTLTPTRLRELYGEVGRAYEALFPDSVQEQLDYLAFLFYRSDDQAKALEYLERAADQAAAMGSAEHQAELLGRARKSAERLGDEAAAQRVAGRLGGLSS